MSSLPDTGVRPDVASSPTPERAWIAELAEVGPVRDLALVDLHQLLVRGARHQVGRMRGLVPRMDGGSLDDLANGAADIALVALLGKLGTFQGRSRFTTWAYKFAILEAATAVRKEAWAGRVVSFDTLDVPDRHAGPAEVAEASDLAGAVRRALQTALTPYQRQIATSLIIDGVPIDVLADRLATTRGALYKTLHMARVRLREHLIRGGYLPATSDGGNS